VPGRRLAAHVLAVPGETKVAFSSSRSVGGAVVRNRARRLMREAWRGLRGRTTGGHWIVLVAKPEIVGSGLQDVMGDLETVLGAAGVTK
jgi:ribonuclease P protein component